MIGFDPESPLTDELFDRTVEQRAQRAQIVAGLYSEHGGDTVDHRAIQTAANQAMFINFGIEVDGIVAERVKDRISAELNQDGGARTEYSIVRHEVVAHVHRELGILNKVMPLPALERVVRLTSKPRTQGPMFPTADEDFRRLSGLTRF